MENRSPLARIARPITLIGIATACLITAAGLATASYTGSDSAGIIHACAGSSSMRIVDHFPCKKTESPLSWNAHGRDGQVGAAGVAGNEGPAGVAGNQGPAGEDGIPGMAGQRGADGAAGPAGPAGPAGSPGAPGTNGLPGPVGPAGPQGPAGPAGPAGAPASGGGGSFIFGRVVNNTDPDCAMTSAMGHTTAAGCSMSPLKTLGDLLPTAATISGFTAAFDKTQTGGHIYAITIDPATARAVDVLLLCTIPAGTSDCDQTGSINLTSRKLLGLEFDGDRSWTGVSYGYTLAAR